MSKVRIAPSLLAADWAELGAEVDALADSGADLLHLDVMDGHFVPNLSFGPAFLQAIRGRSKLAFDTHLMIAPADPYLESFAAAGADCLTIHLEAGAHSHRSLRTIRALGCQAGLAINPGTAVALMEPLLDEIDLALVMTVNPGFGGQAFLASCLHKVEQLAAWRVRAGLDFKIEVDGGVDRDTAAACRDAGADILVAGSAIFDLGDRQDDGVDQAPGLKSYASAIAALRGSD